MASLNNGEFNDKLGIDWDGFSSRDLERMAEKAEPLYKANKPYWDQILTSSIRQFAADARVANKPLVTTECWGMVNYKDYPMLDWSLEKELCVLGVTTAAATGQWVAMATSNFCGPQYKGMWDDVSWHQKLTSIIKSSPIHASIQRTKVAARLG
jgi:hypothetical protein